MKIFKYIGITIALTVLLSLLFMSYYLPLTLPLLGDSTSIVQAVQMFTPIAILAGFMVFSIKYEHVKNIMIIVTAITLLSIIGGSFMSNVISKTDRFNDIKISYNIDRLKFFDNKYPNSADVIELKSLIQNREYAQAQKMNDERFLYVDQLDVSLLANKYQSPELKSVYKKIMEDGYVNQKEQTDLKIAVRDYLLDKIRVD